jgi:hypothetical protein
MKKTLFLFGIVMSFLLISQKSNAQGMQDFTITNNTGMILIDVFISPDNTNEWGNDVIPKDLILDGETFIFKFSVDEQHCVWDIMFTADNGIKYYMQDVNLCNTINIILSNQ